MTVSTTNTFITPVVGNGSTVEFAVNYQFWASSDLKVYLRTIATGVEVLQTITTHYSVGGGSGSDGTVTFVTAPVSTQEVHVRRESAQTQTKDIKPTTVLPSAAIEEALDRSVLLDQEDKTEVARSMRVPVTDATTIDMTLPNSVDRGVTGAYLGFDSSGEPVILTTTVPSAGVTAFMATLLDDASAVAARTTLLLDGRVGKASNTTIAVVATDTTLLVTGGSTVNNITGGVDGQRLLVFWDTGATFAVGHAATGAGQIFLSPNQDLGGHTVGQQLVLVSDGTDWFEVSRSSPTFGVRNVPSAASIAVTADDTALEITGSDVLTNLTGAATGQCLTLRWAAAATFNVTDAATGAGEIHLGTSTNLTGHTAGATLELVSDGVDWYEVGRSSPKNSLRLSVTAVDPLPITAEDSGISLTGATRIDNITGGQGGQRIQLIWAAAATFGIGDAKTGAGQIHLAGNEDLGGHTAGHTLSLIHNGTDWHETSRSSPPRSFRTVASHATDIAVTLSDTALSVTGPTTITNISGGSAGQILVIFWAAAATFNMSDLAGGAGQLLLQSTGGISGYAAGDTVMFISDGTDWSEISRSNN